VTRGTHLRDEARFQRGRADVRVRKPLRKHILRTRHAVVLMVGAAALFFAAYELYAFVITWPKLDVREIRTDCTDPAVAALTAEALGSRAWGNLLLLDMALVRAEARTVSWVKDARVRKVFPSSLRLEVVPRKAAALLVGDAVWLLDEEGVTVERSSPEARPELPLFIDEGRFRADAEAKRCLALACWNDLRPDDRALVRTVDVTVPDDVVLTFHGSETKVRLGGESFGERAAEYLAARAAWEKAFGPLESVLLGLPGRVVLQPLADAAAKEKN
jgi:cell division protein FtsQ